MIDEGDFLKMQQTQGVSVEGGTARQELLSLGLEDSPENREMVEACMRSSQVNDPEKKIYELSQSVLAGQASADELQRMLAEHNPPIKSMIHAEGPTIWHHVKYGLQQIESLSVDEKKKRFYKIVFLYHDIGKTDVKVREANAKKNETPINEKTGQYSVKFIGHSEFDNMEEWQKDKVMQAFRSNGFSDQEISAGLWLIERHMAGGIIDEKSRLANAAKIYLETDPETYQDLIRILQIDGLASVHYSVAEGFSNNTSKSQINGEKQLGNIIIYNGVMSLLSQAPNDKARIKMESEANAFFNRINNFDEIDQSAVAELKGRMLKMCEVLPEKPVPPELLAVGDVLGDKINALAQVYDSFVAKRGNERALQGMVNGILKRQIGLSDDQVAAFLSTLK